MRWSGEALLTPKAIKLKRFDQGTCLALTSGLPHGFGAPVARPQTVPDGGRTVRTRHLIGANPDRSGNHPKRLQMLLNNFKRRFIFPKTIFYFTFCLLEVRKNTKLDFAAVRVSFAHTLISIILFLKYKNVIFS